MDRDRRNCYGESSKGSRIAIRANKKLRNKRERLAANREVKREDAGEIAARSVEKAAKKSGGGFKKYPDMPLREYMQLQDRKLAQRIERKLKKKKPAS